MSFSKDYQYFAIARYHLPDWVKAKLLCTFSSQVVTDLLRKDVICYHGCFEKLKIDNRLENKDIVAEIVEKYMVKKVVVSANHH